MHRHHISYKLGLVVPVPEAYHWFIHVPGSLFLSGTAWWTGKPGHSCVRYQNKRAAAFGPIGRMLLGYPNPIQMILNFVAWILWGYGWAFSLGFYIAAKIL